MEDAAYVQELFAILTNPSPTGIDPADPYGQADDRIDRYDGFGRTLVVTSANVVPGEHGAMVEIGYVLDLPDRADFKDVPRENAVRLPVSAEWRAASNLDDPADYAPLVSQQLMRSIPRHVSAHQPGARYAHQVPGRREQWQVLLKHLRRRGEVTEVVPGHLEVEGRGGTTVTVLITPDQWEQELLRYGLDLFEGHVIDLLYSPEPDEVFLVYWNSDLQRSVREALPPVRPWRPAQFVPGGGWYAYPPDPADGGSIGS